MADDDFVHMIRDRINDDFILPSSGYDPQGEGELTSLKTKLGTGNEYTSEGDFTVVDGEDEAGGTIHLNAVSPDGSWVGITSTVGLLYEE